jgi:hypothetical protein
MGQNRSREVWMTTIKPGDSKLDLIFVHQFRCNIANAQRHYGSQHIYSEAYQISRTQRRRCMFEFRKVDVDVASLTSLPSLLTFAKKIAKFLDKTVKGPSPGAGGRLRKFDHTSMN